MLLAAFLQHKVKLVMKELVRWVFFLTIKLFIFIRKKINIVLKPNWNHGVNNKVLKRPDISRSVQKAQVHGREAQ